MGNYVSTKLSTHQTNKNSKTSTKLILPSGETRQIQAPTKAAELMLDTPGSFVINAKSLKINRKFSPLNADEDIMLTGEVYIMFPMKRVSTNVTATDMGALFLVANKKRRLGNNKVGVMPAMEEESTVMMVPKLNIEEIDDFLAQEFMHRMSVSRSKKPVLETILEEPICSR